MATIQMPPDFKDLLRLLNSHCVEYLIIGGYAVAYHGYPRATMDIDIWVAIDSQNAVKIVDVLKEFGFNVPELCPALFQKKNQVIRMGVPPVRIKMLTGISGVEFGDCYVNRIDDELDGEPVKIISLKHLKLNKKASGRHQDLADLEHLP
ncbi:MAG: hypothetical protein IIC50_02300 [Planctomycetes bacterium]|nr:hypothetical protein [Planctomycetota bacterium]